MAEKQMTQDQDTIVGGLDGDTIVGSNGADNLTGGEGADLIKGKAGNDTISGAGGVDTIYGNRGDDVILGGDGNDYLYGNRGNDTIDGQKGNDFMSGGWGDDRLIWNNGDGSDILRGGQGYDVAEVNDDPVKGDEFVLGQEGHNAIFDRVNFGQFTLDAKGVETFEVNATGGDDKLTVNDLSNTDVKSVKFSGGEGNDVLDASNTGKSTVVEAYGGNGDDALTGGAANDILYGDAGNDDIEGEKGDDTMIGGEGNDTLGWDDGDGSDLMSGGNGYDTVEVDGAVEKGDDFVLNADGDKAIFDRVNLGKFTLTTDTSEKFDVEGLGGDDKFTVNNLDGTSVETVKFSGGDGNDYLDGSNTNTPLEAYGDAGNDTLIGGNGDDTLIGGAGSDSIDGGAGNDVLIGGDGSDIYSLAISATEGMMNTIQDFVSGTDKIMLDMPMPEMQARSSSSGGFDIANEFAVVSDDTSAAGSDAILVYNTGTGMLSYNANGAEDGYGDGGQIVALQGGQSLTAEDIMWNQPQA
jgi:Ca2+-binding RTX toxin-like protein